MINNKNFLFIVVLGGRTKKSHIELHDVRWVVGTKIEDTFSDLREEWFGDRRGLHIDSYIKIKHIDGYKINLKKTIKPNINLSETLTNKKLWFVNLGGYKKNVMSELHQFRLLVAESSKEAINRAKNIWERNIENIHKDDLHNINDIKALDECYSIKQIKNWNIYLSKDIQNRSQSLIPDWYGFMRIDIKSS